MGKRYESGTKNQVIISALMHAIDDRDAMVDAYSNRYYDPDGDPNDPVTGHEFSAENIEYINRVKAQLRDYQKMAKILRGK